MSGLPPKVESLLKSSDKKKLKFVIFRLPEDMKASDLEGVTIDLSDLKVTSVGGNLKAVPDLLTDPDRASACWLLPVSEGKDLRCGAPFCANIQIIRDQKRNVPERLPELQHVIKKESTKKLKKIKSEV
jgi:hypothetical protein